MYQRMVVFVLALGSVFQVLAGSHWVRHHQAGEGCEANNDFFSIRRGGNYVKLYLYELAGPIPPSHGGWRASDMPWLVDTPDDPRIERLSENISQYGARNGRYRFFDYSFDVRYEPACDPVTTNSTGCPGAIEEKVVFSVIETQKGWSGLAPWERCCIKGPHSFHVVSLTVKAESINGGYPLHPERTTSRAMLEAINTGSEVLLGFYRHAGYEHQPEGSHLSHDVDESTALEPLRQWAYLDFRGYLENWLWVRDCAARAAE
ncbi:MAG: hypothetical protein OXB98_06595 [Bryobacterales bacterium]|nr:hypothetical protein [Bryobacterales bacterium]